MSHYRIRSVRVVPSSELGAVNKDHHVWAPSFVAKSKRNSGEFFLELYKLEFLVFDVKCIYGH